MDIQSTGDNLLIATLQNIQKSQNEQLIQIARLVGLTTNSSSKAQVMELMDLSPEDHEQLLTQIDKTLAQIKSSANLPAVQQQMEALEQQKNLLQLNQVKLALLQINSKTFLVYSTHDLQKGQEISLKFVPNIGLQLLGITESKDTIAIQAKIEQIISQNLRQLLPLQKSDNFFSSLNSINQLLKQIPAAQLNQLLDKPIQQVLEKINQLIPDLGKIIDPQVLKVVIEKSGIQFERQLIESIPKEKSMASPATNPQAKAEAPIIKQETTFIQGQGLSPKNLAPLLANTHLATNIAVDKPLINQPIMAVKQTSSNEMSLNATSLNETSLIDQKLLNTLSNKFIANTGETQNNSSINPAKAVNAANLQTLNQANPAGQSVSPQKQQDLKGALVELVSKTQERMANEKPETSSYSTLQTTHLKDFIAQLLPIFSSKIPPKDLSIKVLRTQLIALLQQHAYQAVSKIQIQQLQSLQPQTTASFSDSSQQVWQMEIPIRYQQDIHPMQIHIERRSVEDKESSHDKKRDQIKQWKIMMNFDLPVIGHFYAQLIWLNQQLSATLWAEKADTLQIAKEKMENLRTKLQQEGIIVTQLECLPGAPNRPQNQVNYSLIDITT
jgi:Flagellar hook-length control protein FliK